MTHCHRRLRMAVGGVIHRHSNRHDSPLLEWFLLLGLQHESPARPCFARRQIEGILLLRFRRFWQRACTTETNSLNAKALITLFYAPRRITMPEWFPIRFGRRPRRGYRFPSRILIWTFPRLNLLPHGRCP